MTSTILKPRSGRLSGRTFYRLFGRVVRSDIALPGLALCAPGRCDIEIRRSAEPPDAAGETVYELLTSTGKLNYVLTQGQDGYVWAYPKAGTFYVAADGSLIEWHPASADASDASALLAGPVLGFAMQLGGQLGLHGACLGREGASFGLLAPSGFGKSTLSAILLERECRHLSDDVLAINWRNGVPFALPGSRQVRLWPDSLGRVSSVTRNSQFVSWLDKRSVDSASLGTVCADALPLKGLFVLNPRLDPVPLSLIRLTGLDALTALIAHTYQGHLLSQEQALQVAHFDAFQELAKVVPVFAITYQRSFELLPQIADSVLGALGSPAEGRS